MSPLPIVVVIAIPTVQRGAWAASGDALPGLLVTILDVVTLTCRFLLIGIVLRAINRDIHAQLGGEERNAGDEAWARLVAFGQNHWPSLVLQVILFAVVFVAVNVLLKQVAGTVDARIVGINPEVAAFAVRNALLIPLAVLWLGGVVHGAIVAQTVEAPPPSRS